MLWPCASCWDLLRPELEARGHRTFAMDLPIDQPGRLMDDYAEAALAAIDGKVADDAVLVGHTGANCADELHLFVECRDRSAP